MMREEVSLADLGREGGMERGKKGLRSLIKGKVGGEISYENGVLAEIEKGRGRGGKGREWHWGAV